MWQWCRNMYIGNILLWWYYCQHKKKKISLFDQYSLKLHSGTRLHVNCCKLIKKKITNQLIDSQTFQVMLWINYLRENYPSFIMNSWNNAHGEDYTTLEVRSLTAALGLSEAVLTAKILPQVQVYEENGSHPWGSIQRVSHDPGCRRAAGRTSSRTWLHPTPTSPPPGHNHCPQEPEKEQQRTKSGAKGSRFCW